jgi:hypothetical protein
VIELLVEELLGSSSDERFDVPAFDVPALLVAADDAVVFAVEVAALEAVTAGGFPTLVRSTASTGSATAEAGFDRYVLGSYDAPPDALGKLTLIPAQSSIRSRPGPWKRRRLTET